MKFEREIWPLLKFIDGYFCCSVYWVSPKSITRNNFEVLN